MTHGGEQGFSYVNVLLSTVLVAVLLVPALEALQAATAGAVSHGTAARHLGRTSKMEQVLALPFSVLYAETYEPGGNTTTSISAALSDPAGESGRRVVVVYRYDATAKAPSSADTGLLYVRVYYEDEPGANALDTLTGRWW